MKVLYYGEKYDVMFEKYSNNNVCIRLVDEIGCPCSTASINIVKLPEHYVAIKNYSENKNIDKALIEAGVLEYLVTTIPAENKEIPVYKLSIDAIQKLGN